MSTLELYSLKTELLHAIAEANDLDKLEEVFNKIAVEPDTKAFLANTGSDPLPGNSKLAHELIEQGIKIWGDHVKLAKIEPLS